jgi:hypothetical protein
VLKDKQGDPDVRWWTASTLIYSTEQAAIPDLLAVLKDKWDNSGVRRLIAWELVRLEEPEAVPYLLALITGSDFLTTDQEKVLEKLVQDYATIRTCAKLLRKDNTRSDVHRILWSPCQREKIHVSMIDWKIIRLVKVSKWSIR